jgi:hypothetical protein
MHPPSRLPFPSHVLILDHAKKHLEGRGRNDEYTAMLRFHLDQLPSELVKRSSKPSILQVLAQAGGA